MKPTGTDCPRCAGFYASDTLNPRCLNCGYTYNPPLPIRTYTRHFCTFGRCKKVLFAPYSTTFCEAHYRWNLARGRQAKGRPDTGLPKGRTTTFELREGIKSHATWPIPIRRRGVGDR